MPFNVETVIAQLAPIVTELENIVASQTTEFNKSDLTQGLLDLVDRVANNKVEASAIEPIKYNTTAGCFSVAGQLYKTGYVKDALNMFILAMQQDDSEDLINALDETNKNAIMDDEAIGVLDDANINSESNDDAIETVVNDINSESKGLDDEEEMENENPDGFPVNLPATNTKTELSEMALSNLDSL